MISHYDPAPSMLHRPTADVPPLSPLLRRLLPVVALAATVGFTTVALGSGFVPRTTEPEGDFAPNPDADPVFDDYAAEDGGPGPGPGDPHRPADDLKTDLDPFVPADDLVTDAVPTEVWLTPLTPWYAMAHLEATRVYEWRVTPGGAGPYMTFKVHPDRAIELNAQLVVHVDAQPGFDYDVYFHFGGQSLYGHQLRISYLTRDTVAFTPAVGTAWASVTGPELGEAAFNERITLDLSHHGWPGDQEVRWTITGVHVIATPR